MEKDMRDDNKYLATRENCGIARRKGYLLR